VEPFHSNLAGDSADLGKSSLLCSLRFLLLANFPFKVDLHRTQNSRGIAPAAASPNNPLKNSNTHSAAKPSAKGFGRGLSLRRSALRILVSATF